MYIFSIIIVMPILLYLLVTWYLWYLWLLDHDQGIMSQWHGMDTIKEMLAWEEFSRLLS